MRVIHAGGGMDSVIVQRPARPEAGVPETWTLGPGDLITFGRGGDGPRVDVELPDPRIPRMAGEIAAQDDFWLLSNLGGSLPYVVENPEGGGEFVKVPPGRVRAPIPFELSRLMVPVGEGTEDLLVFAPEHAHLAAGAPDAGERTVGSFSLDETAKHFLVLVGLCEPRLREPSSAAVPSVNAIVERLAEAGEALTTAAVGFHIDYLARHKLRVREHEGAMTADDRLDHKRAALINIALRFDLVRAEHLRLLNGRGPSG